MFIRKTLAAVIATLAAGTAMATEGGGSIYPHGVENFMAGALPPPGTYGAIYLNSYSADRVNDSDGNNKNVPGFKVRANVVAPRLIYRPDAKLWGGDIVVHAIAPLVDLSVTTPGGSQQKTGLGDMTIGAGLGYHHSQSLHSVVALDVYLPTGGYGKNDTANIGRNYAAYEPVYAVSYINPQGFNGDIKLGYIFNQTNTATDYKSGDEFHFDYALGWGFGNGWTAGVGGYYRQQVTDDAGSGATSGANRYSGQAIGPNVKYDSGKGWFITGKWQQEMNVKNGAQGSAFWMKAIFPL